MLNRTSLSEYAQHERVKCTESERGKGNVSKFGDRIRALLEGRSVAWLARHTSIKRRTLYNYVGQDNEPKLSSREIQEIADALGTTRDQILGLSDEAPANNPLRYLEIAEKSLDALAVALAELEAASKTIQDLRRYLGFPPRAKK